MMPTALLQGLRQLLSRREEGRRSNAKPCWLGGCWRCRRHRWQQGVWVAHPRFMLLLAVAAVPVLEAGRAVHLGPAPPLQLLDELSLHTHLVPLPAGQGRAGQCRKSGQDKAGQEGRAGGQVEGRQATITAQLSKQQRADRPLRMSCAVQRLQQAVL